MAKIRKMEMVVTKVTFAEAEEADDLYWSATTAEERLGVLIDLREIFFGDNIGENRRIAKVVIKRSLYGEGN